MAGSCQESRRHAWARGCPTSGRAPLTPPPCWGAQGCPGRCRGSLLGRGEMETSFFQSLIARQPCEEMSYKVQRPLPTAPGAPATAAGDALPSPAWWGARGVPRSLCPGSPWPNPAPMALGENAGWPQPSPHQRGAERWGSRRQPVPRCGAGSAGSSPGAPGSLPGLGVSPCQRSPSCCNAHPHPTASRLPPAAGKGDVPGGYPRSAGSSGHGQPRRPASPPPPPPQLGASCSRQRPVGRGREGTDAAASAAKALPSVCAGLPGWGGGGHCSP